MSKTKNPSTRAFPSVCAHRQRIACVVLALAGLAVASTGGWTGAGRASTESPATHADASSRSIHQEIDFKSSPQRIYEALLDSKQFGAFSGAPAEISREAGGAFSIFNGHIVGRNIELMPNRRIVQAWRVVTWDEGVYSIVKFELKAQGSGTRLIMDHDGFPEGKKEHLDSGWKANYWEPLRKYLG